MKIKNETQKTQHSAVERDAVRIMVHKSGQQQSDTTTVHWTTILI